MRYTTDFVDAVYSDLLEEDFSKEAGGMPPHVQAAAQRLMQARTAAAQAAARARAAAATHGTATNARRVARGVGAFLDGTASAAKNTRGIVEDIAAIRAMRNPPAPKGLSDTAKGALMGAGALGAGGLIAYPFLRGSRVHQSDNE